MNLELGKKIAVLRKMQEVTQAQLADYLMVQPQTVSRWESEGGTPDVTLLPRIAAFFNVSLDELFGLTDMEQIDNLVYKYSVLRDDKSFEEVMRRIEIAMQPVADEEAEKLRQKQEQLLAWKVHIYIQKSRKAMEEAEEILDTLLQNIKEDSKLNVPLKLQKNQFLIQKGEGRAVLEKTKAVWEETASVESLYCYMAALMELDRSREIMCLWETDSVQSLIKKVNTETIPLWQIMFWSVAAERKEEFFQKWFGIFAKEADDCAVFEAEWMWTGALKELGKDDEKEEYKEKLLEALEKLPFNEYLKMDYVKRIQAL